MKQFLKPGKTTETGIITGNELYKKPNIYEKLYQLKNNGNKYVNHFEMIEKSSQKNYD